MQQDAIAFGCPHKAALRNGRQMDICKTYQTIEMSG